MTVKGRDYSQIIRFLDRKAAIWQKRMGLAHIEIEMHYLDVTSGLLLGTAPKNHPGRVRCSYGATGDLTFTAFVETRWNYQMADVHFCLPACVQWPEERLEQILVHEFSHVLCAPEQYLLDLKLEEVAAAEAMPSVDYEILSSMYYERMEMATENVARAVWAGWQA